MCWWWRNVCWWPIPRCSGTSGESKLRSSIGGAGLGGGGTELCMVTGCTHTRVVLQCSQPPEYLLLVLHNRSPSLCPDDNEIDPSGDENAGAIFQDSTTGGESSVGAGHHTPFRPLQQNYTSDHTGGVCTVHLSDHITSSKLLCKCRCAQVSLLVLLASLIRWQ